MRETYNVIAKDFDRTRFKMWSCMTSFYKDFDVGFILDVGCGNGKNIIAEKEVWYELCDLSDEFVKMTHERYKSSGMVQLDATSLQYRSEVFDTVISVAVLHHIETYEKRVTMLKEILRVCKKGGLIFFTVWANTKSCDRMIPWTNAKTKQTTYRFYHLFDEEEVICLLHSCNIHSFSLTFEFNNYVCVVKN
jgi:ubiquinone/menaquinone biosynthesis C-methylase UbiE